MKNWKELSKEISLRYGVSVLRVDNLLVNTDIIDGIVKNYSNVSTWSLDMEVIPIISSD